MRTKYADVLSTHIYCIIRPLHQAINLHEQKYKPSVFLARHTQCRQPKYTNMYTNKDIRVAARKLKIYLSRLQILPLHDSLAFLLVEFI